mmetsp:Transcript_30380/g.35848  ORF Transcript_30380/g.35848 Transcript_30380/m.35848 type:complete len:141 (+) Transcript_30380:110-532(+)|eukprot:CAMPEP_0114358628 /NCGR_PEP_ID=MMETSP0101-20121206/22434_1 /TAXON_ID=38822 ORGANISM="Pteridomonas danica, Strain PT" /NCGR_SAMPLE_ID=MMETSP0101 /ASSEMBLY_ACC=CAM_ASM_000211 /LENGTH=140 /DNA_ID=CAMNT_0001501815 /DNA_START=98 /DNA_END=520 /DNA_ORIENTATION=+
MFRRAFQRNFNSVRQFSTNELPDIVVTKECAKKILSLNKGSSNVVLRLAVDGGGCSGFQYTFELQDSYTPQPEDHIFERDNAMVVVDEDSLELVKGSTVDYVQEMIKSSFVVANNPLSESACGCGSSFALKNFEANPALD